jgi:Ser/Thr protein kinase RdoA (MazF antagonist)
MSIHPYADLTPDVILAALENAGFVPDGRLLALASYENRVYQIGLEDGPPIVAKFYRPARWSDDAILEEHAFAALLAQHEVPVVAPLALGGSTLAEHAGFRFSAYPRRGGRPPELEHKPTLTQLGRFLGRIHAVGVSREFVHRPALSPAAFGHASVDLIERLALVPHDLVPAWQAVTQLSLQAVDLAWQAADARQIRLHGDLHAGNVLSTDAGMHIVDLDDARTGPAIQDMWMLLSGDDTERRTHLAALLEGYETFSEFDGRELALIEPLRTLRLIHYAAWLGQRWSDPAFPIAFPWFNTQRYWQDLILQLREQIAAMQEPPLMPTGCAWRAADDEAFNR